MKARHHFTTGLCLSASLFLLTSGTSPAGQSTDRPDDPARAMAEDVEILRRILVQALAPERGTGGDGYWRARSFVDRADPLDLSLRYAFVGGPSVTHSRAFHAPGSGAFLCLDITVPATQVQVESAAAETNGASDDLWARVEREVRGQGTPDDAATSVARRLTDLALVDSARLAQRLRWTLDPAAVGRVESAVVEALARHGERLEHLGDDETITVALHLSAGAHSTPLGLAGGEEVDWSSWVADWSQQSAPEQRLVVRLACRDIARHARGALELEGLQECATVHRY